MEGNDNVSYFKYRVKYITKAGDVKYYEYKNKYIRKGRGKEIFKKLHEKYEGIINDDSLKAIDKAIKIYEQLDNDDKKLLTVEKIRAFIYRQEYAKCI